ncbi:unnamed protein product [Caenorhabditis bovis]|uniref:Gustatory receptor n=1 Tax=Caenorhabditis bovis TaxID=2654633 RepID=A0A8S1FD31_9PELO|nr:unnamed protein product [Caenorhabditis bovis]
MASLLCIDFRNHKNRPKLWTNAIITTLMLILGTYSMLHNIRTSLSVKHITAEISAQLLVILWAFQSIISLMFFIYWQFFGHLSTFRHKLRQCQNYEGLLSERAKHAVRQSNFYFYFIILSICFINTAFSIKYYTESQHSEFKKKQATMFYYSELRPIYAAVTTYLYLVWNITLFVMIHYTNATYHEVCYFNKCIDEFDGNTEETNQQLLHYLETYSKLCSVIRFLDQIFRLYAFIMIVITVPSMILTLMMLNHRIHSIKDFLVCFPTIALCVFSFFAVTIAPARLHDEICRSKGFLCQNRSVWFPYRKETYIIANTLTSHMEQFDLGVSVWGFALLSRPLILGTLSVTMMMLGLIIEVAPKTDLLQ